AHAGSDRQPVLVRRIDEREGTLAVVAHAWKILRQEKVDRFARREFEPVRLFEMKANVARAISSLPNSLLSYLPMMRVLMRLPQSKPARLERGST
ncbi:MAG: hypothetical protein WBE50_08285, partial [Methyloceanibacter sp.]